MTRRTHSLNAYESAVVAGGAGSTGDITVESAIGLFATADNGQYFVVDPESATVREYIKVVDVDTGTGVLTCASFRGLGGSVGSTSHAHDGGAIVRAVAVSQWLDDIFDDITDHEAAGDPHPQYLEESVAATTYVEVAGDTMTGELVVPPGAPTADDVAANKKYVDDEVAAVPLSDYLPLVGGTLSGDLIMNGVTASPPVQFENDTAEDTKIHMKSGDSNLWLTSDDIDVLKLHRTEARFLQKLTLDEDPTDNDGVGDRAYNDARYIKYVDWAVPTLLNSWVNFGAGWQDARYRKNYNVVEVQGFIKDGTTTANTILFTLPAGFRPEAKILIPSITATHQLARIDIGNDGNVTLGAVPSSSWLSISFSFSVD